jgi:hypothetical protein
LLGAGAVVGLLGDGVDGRLVEEPEEPVNERCEIVGLARALALAAVFSAFGERAG